MSNALAQDSHFETMALTEVTTPPIGLNRPPGEEERRALLEVIERDEKSLTRLQDLADNLSVKVHESNLIASHSLVQLQYASLRQEAAMDLHERLSRATDILGAASHIIPKMERLEEESTASPHLREVASTLHKQSVLTERLTRDVAEAAKSVKRAMEDVTVAKEDYQAAVTIASLLEKERGRSRESIKALEWVIRTNKISLHPWFRTPWDIWEQILSEVVSADGEMETNATTENAKERGHGYRTIVLSSVCYDWRMMIQSLPSLWRNIYIPLDLRLRSAATRIRIHLKYSRAYPLKVVIYSPSVAVPIQSLESPLPWKQHTSIHEVTCLASHESYCILSDLLHSLPPPARLVLLGDQSLGPFRSDNGLVPLLLPGHFFKNMRYLFASEVPTRVDSSGSTVDQSALTQYIHYGYHVMRCALPNWIPNLGANLQGMCFEAAHPRLLPSTQGPTSHTFTNVSVLRISALTLAQFLACNITFPSLTELEFLHTVDTTDADWRELQAINCQKMAVSVKTIQKQHVSHFVAFLNQCKMVSHLVLCGGAVRTILDEADNPPLARFQHIERLGILNCSDGHEAVLLYLQRLAAALHVPGLQAADEPNSVENRGKCALSRLGFYDCNMRLFARYMRFSTNCSLVRLSAH